MNKGIVSIGAAAGGIAGAFVPVWLGGDNGLGGWSVLGAFIGGLLGIIVTVWLSRRFMD